MIDKLPPEARQALSTLAAWELGLFTWIVLNADADGKVTTTTRAMSEALKVDDSTLTRGANKLKSAGLIEVFTERGRGGSTTYKISHFGQSAATGDGDREANNTAAVNASRGKKEMPHEANNEANPPLPQTPSPSPPLTPPPSGGESSPPGPNPIQTLSPTAQAFELQPLMAGRTDEDAAFRAYNATAERCGLSKAQKMTGERRRLFRKRLKDCGGIDGWEAAMGRVEASPFLQGQNDKGWRANLDFLLEEDKFTKLMEGAYDPSPNGGGGGGGGFEQELRRMAMETDGGPII